MPRLPNIEAAVLDVRKLAGYCLDSAHPRGRHKARVFRQTLGVGRDDADWLKGAILAALSGVDAVELERDVYGARWRADVALTRQNRQAVVRTVWMIRAGERIPRFVTCWVL
ncbi:DUF6883 domain-containing protein [Pseudorhodoplanes sp.]|uniref:DUF6883 domain-containing protein n=1 Tax=Pseudorhodoplanes sp. TaxID=1934341 RepID=UPI00391B482E